MSSHTRVPGRLSSELPGTGQQVLSHGTVGTLNLAPPNSHGAMTVSNQRRDKIRSALKMSSSYGCAELMQQQVCERDVTMADVSVRDKLSVKQKTEL